MSLFHRVFFAPYAESYYLHKSGQGQSINYKLNNFHDVRNEKIDLVLLAWKNIYTDCYRLLQIEHCLAIGTFSQGNCGFSIVTKHLVICLWRPG